MFADSAHRCWARRIAGLLVVGFLALVALAAAPEANTPARELARLRALLVIDTRSDLRDSVTADRRGMEGLLRAGVPESRLDLTILSDEQATPDNILAYYRNLTCRPSEALLFFYAGHGANDLRHGHYLALQAPRHMDLLLTRAALRQAMQEKGAALVVLLTDCCSNILPMPTAKPTRGKPVEPPTDIQPVLRCLFFQQRGVVDITASTNDSSWGDDQHGGIFTRTLARLMAGDLKTLDSDGDGFVTWKEFFPILTRETEGTFVAWATERRTAGETVDQKSQTPRLFRLLPDAPLEKQKDYAVVSLTNRTKAAVAFRYHWSSDENWTSEVLPAGQTITLFRPLADPEGPLPLLEIVQGDAAPSRLEARRWTGSSTPGMAAGTRYSIRPAEEESRRNP